MYTDSENNSIVNNTGIPFYKKEPEMTAQVNPKAYLEYQNNLDPVRVGFTGPPRTSYDTTATVKSSHEFKYEHC